MFEGKIKELREYYGNLDINQKANLIGITPEMLNNVKVNKDNNQRKNISALKNIFKRINSISNIESFNQELLIKLNFITQYGVLSIYNNVLLGIYHDKFNRYIICLSMEDNKIQYFTDCFYKENKIKKEAFLSKFFKNTIVESKIDRESLNNIDSDNPSFVIIQSYDNFGYEEFRHTCEKNKNYEKNIDLWKMAFSLNALKRERIQYNYSNFDKNRNICSIGTVDNNFNKDLVVNNDFKEFDLDLYHLYIQGKCKIEDILKNINNDNSIIKKKEKN